MSETYLGRYIQFGSGTKAARAEKLLAPDANGISREVSIEEFEKNGLGFGNGGDWPRKDGTFCKKYIVDPIRSEGRGNKIVAIRTIGFATTPSKRSIIPQEIRKIYKGYPCPVLGTSVGENEIDHKDGYNSTGTMVDDFQPLSKAANDAKRQYCKKCRETGKRYDATRNGFKYGWTVGTSIYTKELKCKGCFWHDPRDFHATMSSNFKK